ncbi:MAG TPA: trimethylamine methyltransferase family protein [Thermoplasmata archaeon]|jgi:trimethylamine--corrinoid protein Co-methyltransferase
MLSEDDLELLDEATMKILGQTGVAVYERQSRETLEKNGSSVDRASSRVKIPEKLVRESLDKIPRKFKLGGRDRSRSLSLGSGSSYFTNSLQGINVIDPRTGETRQSLLSDVADFAKVVDALRNIDFFGVTVVAHDVPGEFHYVKELATAVQNTSKHIEHGCHGTEMAKGFVKIAQVVSGGEEALRKEPAVSCFGCPVSPLQFDGPNTEAMVECAKAGMPYDVLSMAMSGASAPMSLAGTLAVINAEVLAGTTICQLFNPGTPIIYGSVASIMDMRTGVMALGAPERPVINTGVVELAHFYGFPALVGGVSTDGKLPGEQVMMEKVMTGLPPLLAGSDVVFGAALLCSATTYSIEQLVADDEVAGALRRVKTGMEVSSETIALEAIGKAGPGGSYLGMKHTIDHLRKDIWMPEMVDRNVFDNWARMGSRDLRAKAREKALEILRTHQPMPLEKEQKQEIDKVVLECSRLS